jgi:hypothetical protein
MMGKLTRTFKIGWFADDRVSVANLAAEAVAEALLDKADGEMGDVDADPAPAQALRDLDGGAAAAEGVEDDVAFVGAGANDAFEESFGFLRGVAEALLCLGVNGRYIVPQAVSRFSC